MSAAIWWIGLRPFRASSAMRASNSGLWVLCLFFIGGHGASHSRRPADSNLRAGSVSSDHLCVRHRSALYGTGSPSHSFHPSGLLSFSSGHSPGRATIDPIGARIKLHLCDELRFQNQASPMRRARLEFQPLRTRSSNGRSLCCWNRSMSTSSSTAHGVLDQNDPLMEHCNPSGVKR